MSITLILHEASRTGAPRVGGLVAAALMEHDAVDVIVMRPGPLVPWLERVIGTERLTVCEGDEFAYSVPFKRRLRAAKKLLDSRDSDIIYVNSVAASPFVIAGKQAGRGVILHGHEKAAELRSLLRLDGTKVNLMRMVDAVVLAADTLGADMEEIFGFLPDLVQNFGTIIDIEDVRMLANEPMPPPVNAAGEKLEFGNRFVVGMCGVAAARKGSDIFFQLAKEMPEMDFLWVGGWSLDEAPDNLAYADFLSVKLPNLFVTGSVDNPYAYIAKMDLFFLSSREDPNPLVLAEALVLQVPILCFSYTTAVTAWVARNTIMCYGPPNVTDAARVLRSIDRAEFSLPEYRSLYDSAISRFEVRNKLKPMLDMIAEVRSRMSVARSPQPIGDEA